MVHGEDDRADRDGADIAVLDRLRRGDAAAVAELYDRYAKTAMGLAARIVRDDEEAQDVVHDAFLAVVERAHQYHAERGTVAAWLLTTVRNLSLDRTRRKTRRAQIVDSDLRHDAEARVEGVEDPEQSLALARERLAVRSAMSELPTAQRETLLVAFFEGLSYPEMAARDAVPLGTIKSRAARAIHALRHHLADRGLGLAAEVALSRADASAEGIRIAKSQGESAGAEKKPGA
jgi:RNA polymerase sigma-70 factor (ECF subfamily)